MGSVGGYIHAAVYLSDWDRYHALSGGSSLSTKWLNSLTHVSWKRGLSFGLVVDASHAEMFHEYGRSSCSEVSWAAWSSAAVACGYFERNSVCVVASIVVAMWGMACCQATRKAGGLRVCAECIPRPPDVRGRCITGMGIS